MKKLLVTLVLMSSMTSFAQIEILKANRQIESRISYAYIEKSGKENYNFFFKNMNSVSHEYVNFSFRQKTSDYDDLYTVIVNGFENAPAGGDPIKIKANGELIGLKYLNENGNKLVQFQKYSDGDSASVSKLFRKEDMTALFKK